MKRKVTNKRCFFVTVCLLAVCVLVGGCCWDPQHKNITPGRGSTESFEREKAELKALARTCGIPESKINSMTSLALISEIKIKLGNSEGYYGKTLSDADMSSIKALLADEPQLERTVREYDAFVKKAKGRTVIILP